MIARAIALIVLTGLACACVHTPSPPLLERAVFFGATAAAFGELSPDGQRLAYGAPHLGRLNVWVRDVADPKGSARPITAFTRGVLGAINWSADGRYVLVAHDAQGREQPHLFRADPDGGVDDVVDLTPLTGVTATLLAAPASTPQRITVTLNARDRSTRDAFYIDLQTRSRTLAYLNTTGAQRLWTNLRGEPALALRSLPDARRSIERIDTPQREVLWRCATRDLCLPIVLRDADVLVASNAGSDKVELRSFDLTTRRWTTLHTDPLATSDLAGVTLSPDGARVHMVSYRDARLRHYPLTGEFEAALAVARQTLPDADLQWRSPGAKERFWIVKEITDVGAGRNYRYDAREQALTLLYDSFPDLPRARMQRREAVRYRARDGQWIDGYLTRPARANATGAAIVIVHGGPWERADFGWDARAQFFANRGYVVMEPNFRGSNGYGKAFLNAANGQWGRGVAQHDVSDAALWLVRQGHAQRDRVGIMGNSYGGYAVLSAAAFTPDLFAAGVAIAAPSDLPHLLDNLPAAWQRQRDVLYERIGHPHNDRTALEKASPRRYVDDIVMPLLIVHGEHDPRVPFAQATLMVDALRAAQRDVTFIALPGQGHQATGDRLLTYAAAEQVFARHLGGRAQPLSSAQRQRLEQLQQ